MPIHVLATAQALPLKCMDSTLALLFVLCWQDEVCHDVFGFIANQVIVLKTAEWCKVKFPNNSFSGL